jgi:hypothetical protein
MRRISLAVTLVAIALMGWFAGAQAPHGVAAQDATPAAGDDGMNGVTFAPLAISDVPALALPGTALVAKITIAERLYLSPKTVRNQISNIIGKLEVESRSEAIVRAREAGLG